MSGKKPSCVDEINHGADYTAEEFEFLKAMDQYKRIHRRPYPTCREVLRIVHALGYRKVPPEPTEIRS